MASTTSSASKRRRDQPKVRAEDLCCCGTFTPLPEIGPGGEVDGLEPGAVMRSGSSTPPPQSSRHGRSSSITLSQSALLLHPSHPHSHWVVPMFHRATTLTTEMKAKDFYYAMRERVEAQACCCPWRSLDLTVHHRASSTLTWVPWVPILRPWNRN